MAKAKKPTTKASIAKKKKLKTSPEKKVSKLSSKAKKVSAEKTVKKVIKKSSVKKTAKPGKKASAESAVKTTRTSKVARGAKSRSSGEAGSKKKEESSSKRKLGLRGAAPWAARHAAKHAAEARARAAEPAPPGSARATIRVPTGAEEIKAKIGELHNQLMRFRTLRKHLDKRFYEVGQLLDEIQQQELYLAKGFGSFEAFLEREIDIGKQTALKLIKIAHVFQQDAALDYGMDRLFAAIAALEGESGARPSIPSAPGSKPLLPLKPPSMRIMG